MIRADEIVRKIIHLDGIDPFKLDQVPLFGDEGFQGTFRRFVARPKCLIHKHHQGLSEVRIEVADQVPTLGQVDIVLPEESAKPFGHDPFAGAFFPAHHNGRAR